MIQALSKKLQFLSSPYFWLISSFKDGIAVTKNSHSLDGGVVGTRWGAVWVKAAAGGGVQMGPVLWPAAITSLADTALKINKPAITKEVIHFLCIPAFTLT